MRNKKLSNFSQEIIQKGYEIERLLAKKAGRRTFLARNINSQELVIVKVLAFSNDFSWEDLKLFEREAQTLQTLEHPSIPRYIDYFELDASGGKTYALVQSYIKGKSLDEYLKEKGKFTEVEIKKIARSLLEILIYLHRRQPPLIHRDIKPSNIILAESPYLVDFGSVQTLASKAGKTVTVVGTYGYMSPEQFGGSATAASDLYSLGATLITLATGIQPADLPQRDMQIAFEEFANLTPGFVEWLRWLIEPSLDRRASSAENALEALQKGRIIKAESEAVIQYKPVGTWELFGQIMWRSIFIGGGVLFLAGAVFGLMVSIDDGTAMGLSTAAIIGIPLALGNGLFVGIITRFFFYPLKNSFLHRRITNLFSMFFCTAFLIVSHNIIIMNNGSRPGLKHLYVVIVSSAISGLSMGVANKYFVRWYEKQSRLRKQ